MATSSKQKRSAPDAHGYSLISRWMRSVRTFFATQLGGADTPSTNFKAFISYKHTVRPNFTSQLEKALKVYAKPLLARPVKIFRDDNHFAPGIDLPGLIIDALESSEFLIFLASPQAAQSTWVNDELDHWCAKLKLTKNLIILLVEGEITTKDDTKQIDWERTNALPLSLRSHLKRVPLYIDMRELSKIDQLTLSNPDFKKTINGISARFRGIDPNEMLGEEVKSYRRSIKLRNSAVSALAILSLIAITTAFVAVAQRKEALQQAKVALSRQHAAESSSLISTDLDQAIFRAVSSVNASQTFEGQNVLFQALTYNPEIEAFIYRRQDKSNHPVLFSFDSPGSKIIIADGDTLKLIDSKENIKPIKDEARLPTGQVSSIAYSHTGKVLAVGGSDGSISVANLSRWPMMAKPVKISENAIDRLVFNAADDQLFAISGEVIFSLSVHESGLTLVESVKISGESTEGRRAAVANTAVSADGRFLVTGAGTHIIVWDMRGSIRKRYSFDIRKQFTYVVREVAFSPDGEKLAVDLIAASDGIPINSVEIYGIKGLESIDGAISITNLHSLTTEKFFLRNYNRLAFNSNSDQLLMSDRDSVFKIVNLNRGEDNNGTNETTGSSDKHSTKADIKSIKVTGITGMVYEPHFSPDDKRILLGVGRNIILWNRNPPPKFERSLTNYVGAPVSLRYSENYENLIMALNTGFVHVFDLHGKSLEVPKWLSFKGNKIFLSKNGEVAAFVEGDQLNFQEAKAGKLSRQFGLDGWEILALSSDGAFIAQFRDGVLRVLNTSNFSEIWRSKIYDNSQVENPPIVAPGANFSKDGSHLIVHISGEKKLTMLDVSSGNLINNFDTGAERFWDWPPVASDNGEWIATAADSLSVSVINTLTREVNIIDVRGNVCSVVFSPDNERIAISYESEEEDADESFDSRYHPAEYGVVFWKVLEGRSEAFNIKTSQPPCQVVFNQKGDQLAVATSAEEDEPAQISIWNISTTQWVEAALRYILYPQ